MSDKCKIALEEIEKLSPEEKMAIRPKLPDWQPKQSEPVSLDKLNKEMGADTVNRMSAWELMTRGRE